MTPAIDDLLDALEDVDDATREEAAKALAELGTRARWSLPPSLCG